MVGTFKMSSALVSYHNCQRWNWGSPLSSLPRLSAWISSKVAYSWGRLILSISNDEALVLVCASLNTCEHPRKLVAIYLWSLICNYILNQQLGWHAMAHESFPSWVCWCCLLWSRTKVICACGWKLCPCIKSEDNNLEVQFYSRKQLKLLPATVNMNNPVFPKFPALHPTPPALSADSSLFQLLISPEEGFATL